MIENIEQQKTIEDQYYDQKLSGDPPSLPLTDDNVAKSISIVQSLLADQRGITGIPLAYVTRHDPNVTPAHNEKIFGHPDTRFISYDDEMIHRAAIFSRDVNTSEVKGPFNKVFLADSATVFGILEKCFNKTSFWINAKKYEKTKEGRMVWITLLHTFYGDDRATSIAETLRTKIKNLNFKGPTRNYDFPKYCNMHTAIHTQAVDILQYQTDKDPIFSESTKIQLFQDGITDPYFDTIKGIVNAQRYKYATFDSVKDAYINFTRTSKRPEIPRDNSDRRIVSDTRSKTPKTSGATTKKQPTQAEIDACTHITLKKYSHAAYEKFTAAEKAKNYQLKVAAGYYDKNKKRTVAEVSTDTEMTDETSNKTNPALTRQAGPLTKKPKTEE